MNVCKKVFVSGEMSKLTLDLLIGNSLYSATNSAMFQGRVLLSTNAPLARTQFHRING